MIGPWQAALMVLAAASLAGCGDDAGAPVTNQRGVPDQAPITNKPQPAASGGDSSRRSTGTTGTTGTATAEPASDERPERPRPILTRNDFSGRARDPFHNYLVTELLVDSPPPAEIVSKQRAVKLPEYGFDELRLIAIVNAGRSVAPRALFLTGDNTSTSVRQGEYFSNAEVLLASVNRDYIEIEVVDPELTPGWNLERGERKVIYLKNK